MPLPMIGMGAATIGGALIGAAGSLFSGKQSADFSEKSYKHRYQWQVEDLKKAGLNPMLAYSQGAPNVAQPNFPNTGEAAVRGASTAVAAKLAMAQMENVKADTELKGSATALNVANARSASIEAGIKEASLPWAPVLAQATAQGADKQIALMQTQINEIAERTVGHRLSNEQLTKIQPLLVKAQELANKGADLDMMRRAVENEWYNAMGASDKYGPAAKFLLQLLERFTRVK